MATVPLDGIKIDVAHQRGDDVSAELEAFGRDLASNKFPDWDVQLERADDGVIHLSGGHDGTSFEASVSPHPGRVVVEVNGTVSIGMLKLALAGGAQGLRKIVASQIEKALSKHLAG